MPGRTYTAGSLYRYGFNGKENDNDIKGEGNQQDYGMRIYDPRLGKFLSVDPITASYPQLTPYQFASNSPIAGIDLDGLEFFYSADGKKLGKSGTGTQFRVATKYSTVQQCNTNGTIKSTIYYAHAWTEYKTNSDKTRLGRNEVNGFTGITTLTESDLSHLLDFSSFIVERIYSGNVEAAMLGEANAGPWKNPSKLFDFKHQVYKLFDIDYNNLINIDGTLYNANEVGNYVWGMVIERLGGLIDAEAIGDAGSIYDHGRLDEPWDKKAIKAGKNKAYSVGFSKEYDNIFLDYLVEYEEWIKAGNSSSTFKPSSLLGVYKQANDKQKDSSENND